MRAAPVLMDERFGVTVCVGLTSDKGLCHPQAQGSGEWVYTRLMR